MQNQPLVQMTSDPEQELFRNMVARLEPCAIIWRLGHKHIDSLARDRHKENKRGAY